MIKSPSKKQNALPKKAVPKKRSTAKKITLKNFDDHKPAINTAAKSPAKTPPKKEVKPALKKAVKSTPQKNRENLDTVKSLVQEMRREHHKRDQQITSMVHEISQGFNHFAEQGNAREERNLEMLKALTEAIRDNHQDIRKATQRNRQIAVPAGIIAVLAVLSILYLVNILGSAMNSMAHDMHKIQLSVDDISTRMDSLTLDINSMSGNIQQLNRNVTKMSKDLGVLSYNIAPNLRGMRNAMPWAPE